MFENYDQTNSVLYLSLFQKRQLKIIYFLKKKEMKSKDPTLKHNIQSVWFFHGFNEFPFDYLTTNVVHDCKNMRIL